MAKKKHNTPPGGSKKRKSTFLDSKRGVVPQHINKFGSGNSGANSIRSKVTHRKAV